MKIAIIGLGYVGLPLAIQFARSGVEVVGLDIDAGKIDKLQRGESYIGSVSNEAVAAVRKQKTFESSTDFKHVSDTEAVIICVPTPLNKNREPDISYILKTGEQIAPHLKRGTLVVLESTSYPGTTEDELRRVLEENAPFVQKAEKLKSGDAETNPQSAIRDSQSSSPCRMVAGRDFHLAFSPEREDPGNPSSKVADIPKIVGGLTPECLRRAVEIYSKAINTVIPMSSCRAAEATKLLENIFRSVNIALVNELKVIYAAMGIDIWEVVEAAKTKPFGYMPFYPGPGLGGHCIPIDPFYLTWKAREFGKHTRFIELAGEINTAMPEYVVAQTINALNSQRKSLNGSKVLLIGLAYKPNVDDMRESATFLLMDLLKKRGASVEYYDPHILMIKPTREHDNWTGKQSIEWSEESIRGFDAVVISTAHAAINYGQLAQWSDCIIDTRNAMAAVKTKSGQVWKA